MAKSTAQTVARVWLAVSVSAKGEGEATLFLNEAEANLHWELLRKMSDGCLEGGRPLTGGHLAFPIEIPLGVIRQLSKPVKV